MDAQQTNRIFWVGATAAALWLTYRALKKPATLTTIATSNTPVSIVENPESSKTDPPIFSGPVVDSPVVTNPDSTDQGWGWGTNDGYNPNDSQSWAANMTQGQIDWVNGVMWTDLSGFASSPLYSSYLSQKAMLDAEGVTDYTQNAAMASMLSQIRGRLFTYEYPT